MTALPLRLSAAGLDLSPRVKRTATVVASPADATETIIASLTVAENIATELGVVLVGFAAFTVGTTGVSVNLRVRKTDVSGTILRATGATTATAADLDSRSLVAVDTAPTLPNQVYVLTMAVGSATAASTVSAVELVAFVV